VIRVDRAIPCCLEFYPVSGLPAAGIGVRMILFIPPFIAAWLFTGQAIRSWVFRRYVQGNPNGPAAPQCSLLVGPSAF